ncbi:MAG: hypothetical protein ABUT20_63145 [Bacteroidota bacterium]
MAISKKKVIKSLENLSEDLRELIKEQYPNGYESSITRIMNAKKEPIFVFSLDTEDATYLVKVPATKNSDGGYDVESEGQDFEGGGSGDDVAGGSDDDFGSSGGGDSDDDDYGDDDGGKSGSREASYDPDFDA